MGAPQNEENVRMNAPGATIEMSAIINDLDMELYSKLGTAAVWVY